MILLLLLLTEKNKNLYKRHNFIIIIIIIIIISISMTPRLVYVEGNIGSGKSTFLNYIGESSKYKDDCIVIPEPLNLWFNVKGYNLLQLYYKSPKRYSAPFQCHIFLTMIHRHNLMLKQIQQQEEKKDKKIKIVFMERSLESGVYCFSRVLCARDMISQEFQDIFENDFKFFCGDLPTGTIYFQSKDIHTLKKRIMSRNRVEEKHYIEDSFLSELNSAHDKLFIRDNSHIIPADLDLEILKKKYYIQVVEKLLDC